MIKYAVTSFHNMGVLTVTHNILVANYLIEGIGDCFIRPVAQRNSVDYEQITFDRAKNSNITLDKMLLIKPLDEVTDSFLQTKELSRHRQNLFNLWFVWNEGLISRTNKFISTDFIQLAKEAVAGSDPNKEDWHRWVLEHAAIQDLDPRAAYQDLKITADCDPEIRFRVNSLAIKWARRINASNLNNLKDHDFKSRLIAEMYAEYWGNKEI